MTREQMHIKALSRGIDSQTIKGSMTVILLGHAVDMMMEMQDTHEAELKAKDEKIYDLRGLLEIAYRDAISIGMAHQQDCKAKDERIAELEAMVQKMKCCENCKHVVFDYGGTDCLISKTGCKIAFNNLTEDFWQLKDTK